MGYSFVNGLSYINQSTKPCLKMYKPIYFKLFKNLLGGVAFTSLTFGFLKSDAKNRNSGSRKAQGQESKKNEKLPSSSEQPCKATTTKDERQIENRLRWILRQLPVPKGQRCAGQLTALALSAQPDGEREVFVNEADWMDFDVFHLPDFKRKTLTACLLALSRHTKGSEQCRLLCELDGLSVLREVLSCCKNDNAQQLVAMCVYNISRQTDCHQHLLNSGLISELYTWLNSSNFALVILSATALRNLTSGDEPLADGVHCVQPLQDSREEYEADIVFVHGLNGSAFRTWRQFDQQPRLLKGKENSHRALYTRHSEWDLDVQRCVDLTLCDQANEAPSQEPTASQQENCDEEAPYTYCWPKDWLGEDLSSCRIWMVDYETYYSNWLIKCSENVNQRSLSARSKKLLHNLQDAGIGSKPIVWVGHSMGGLLIKQVLLDSESQSKYSSIIKQTKAVLFLSTPHRGTDTLKQLGSLRYVVSPTTESQELEENSDHLLNLQMEFKRLALSFDFRVLSLGEADQTPLRMGVKVMMVSHTSSDPDVGSYVLLDSNHLYICKPRTKESPLYRLVKDFVEFSIGIHHHSDLNTDQA